MYVCHLHVFSVRAMVRGYHYYKAIWEAAIDWQVLSCEREVGNVHDTFAIPEFAITICLQSQNFLTERSILDQIKESCLPSQTTCQPHMRAIKFINIIFTWHEKFFGKFWTRNLWRFPTNSPNSPKFSPTNIFRYTVSNYCSIRVY